MNALPIVLACSGCSFAGQLANQVACELDKRGIAQMSCLAGVGAQRPYFLKLIASRPVWLIDGCPIQCGQGIFDLIGRQPDRHIRLHDLGFKKNAPPAEGVNLDSIIATIVRQTSEVLNADALSRDRESL
jgi:uncharacterized metal-binding protein